MAEVIVDTKKLEKLGADFVKAKRQLIGQVAERGYQLLRKEVPVQTTNLQQGVAPPEVDYENLTAKLIVSARSGATGPRVATLYGADGEKKKTVSLRGNAAYNYAEVVARGNKDAVLRPKRARAFLIPVPSKPEKGGYLMIGAQIFVMRTTRKAQKANPFDERAAKQLETDAPKIAESVLTRLLK